MTAPKDATIPIPIPEKAAKRIHALDEDYARRVATQWPMMEHAQVVIDHLPDEVRDMLADESDDFLKGWFNAIAMVHDLGIKVLVEELAARTGGIASDSRDMLLTKIGSVVEVLGYLACRETEDRRNPNDQSTD